MGNDAIKFAARIHGQCELHCWVKGENRNWLAGVIEAGLSSGIYRQQQGWEDVQALLKEDDSTSVVLSYSVCDSFPNSAIAGFVPTKDEDGDDSWDAWHNLDFSVQWQQACEGLERSGGGLELSPANWNTFYFAHGWDAFKLNQLFEWAASETEIDPFIAASNIVKFYQPTNFQAASQAWRGIVDYYVSKIND
jgi:hypothetical protein